MLNVFLARMKQGHRTIKYPAAPAPELPDRFRGVPSVDRDRCPAGCADCAGACPTGAIIRDKGEGIAIDLSLCLFCNDCVDACRHGAISFTGEYRMAARHRGDLLITAEQDKIRLAEELGSELKRLYGRSFKLRQVSAGGCNACEADSNVLTTIGWDLGRFGIQFVASPRHADGLLITGPVTANMETALKKTWDALPDPKVVIAVGACAISGGPYEGHSETRNGADTVVPVDLYIPGCPPHPLTILDGLLRLLGRVS